MAYVQKDNSGALFKNDKREKDTQPHMNGTIMVAGVEYWISAWTNVSEKGVRYQSLSVQPKQQAHDNGIAQAQYAAGQPRDGIIPARPAPQIPEAFADDDIPF